MKKILLTLLAATPLMFSCSSDDNGNNNGEGSMIIAPTINKGFISVPIDITRATPTDDLSSYRVILTGAANRDIAYPSNGVVTNIPVGSYQVTVASHSEMPDPAFDVQYYKGTTSAAVTLNDQTPVQINARLANAGVFFIYDDEFANNGITVIPTVAGSDGKLEYAGSNSESTGYFAPGEVTISLRTSDGKVLLINGETSAKETLKEREVWEITLAYDENINSGSIKMNINVIDTVTDQYISFNVGETEQPSPLFIDELVGTWDVDDFYMERNTEGISGWRNAHEVYITKIDDTTIQIDNATGINDIYDIPYGTLGDQITATVNNDNKTITVPYQMVTPTWAKDQTVSTYFSLYIDNSDNLANNANSGFQDVAVTQSGNSYSIDFTTKSVYAVTFSGVQYGITFCPLAVQGSTVSWFAIYYSGTKWVKQSSSSSGAKVKSTAAPRDSFKGFGLDISTAISGNIERLY